MDHYSTFAVHRPTMEKFGKATDRFTRWTRVENIVGNGAFRLKEWKLNRRITIAKSDTYWDRDKVKLNGVVFYPTENISSEERMFRVGQLHYTQTIPLDKIPVYRAMENSPYVNAPYLGTYYYLLNINKPPLDDVRVRQALSMAIDREKLNARYCTGPMCPPTASRPRHPGLPAPKLFDSRCGAGTAAAGRGGLSRWAGLAGTGTDLQHQ